MSLISAVNLGELGGVGAANNGAGTAVSRGIWGRQTKWEVTGEDDMVRMSIAREGVLRESDACQR